jgi:hypothetical protein
MSRANIIQPASRPSIHIIERASGDRIGVAMACLEVALARCD